MIRWVSEFVRDYYCDECGEFVATNEPAAQHDVRECLRNLRKRIEALELQDEND